METIPVKWSIEMKKSRLDYFELIVIIDKDKIKIVIEREIVFS